MLLNVQLNISTFLPHVDTCRASAECGEAAETLPAEHNDAGADWLLHSHGRILHEGVGQQGQLNMVLFLYFISCTNADVKRLCKSFVDAQEAAHLSWCQWM